MGFISDMFPLSFHLSYIFFVVVWCFLVFFSHRIFYLLSISWLFFVRFHLLWILKAWSISSVSTSLLMLSLQVNASYTANEGSCVLFGLCVLYFCFVSVCLSVCLSASLSFSLACLSICQIDVSCYKLIHIPCNSYVQQLFPIPFIDRR